MKTIELNEWEINTILNVLGERPYSEVACIIRHITEQVEKQESVGEPATTSKTERTI